MTAKEPPIPLPAATVLLLRDGAEGLEVFMVRRTTKMDFAAGALVFPGGKVETSDALPMLRERCGDVAGIDDFQLALRVAAVRETFEECGVLLARPRSRREIVPVERVRALEAKYRDALMRDEIGIDTMIEAENLDLACDLLVYYAHWITPVIRPKRFDTHFFLAPAPVGQHAEEDARGAPPVHQLVERRAHGASRVEHVVHDHHDAPVDPLGGQARLSHHGAGTDHAQVVAVQGDVEGADWGRGSLRLLDLVAQKRRDLVAAAVDPHQDELLGAARALDGHTRPRAPWRSTPARGPAPLGLASGCNNSVIQA